MNFNELGIEKQILKALQEAGYTEPTPIQEKAIPAMLDGHDLLACAQTGTGKTCAFAVPIIQRLSERAAMPNTIRALILTPTRELALQIYENVCQYSRYSSKMAAVIYGGVSQIPQVEAIKAGAEILIATPGRLWDLMGQGHIKLDKVEFFVLDEADRMLDMGFFPDVKRIVKHLPDERQTLLFSATMPNEIAKLADSLLTNPIRIAITPSARPVEIINQVVYHVEKANKRELLQKIIQEKNVAQTLVFTRTKHGADRVARDLNRAGIKAKAIHGDKSQNARQTALKEFKACKIAVLVATDIAARGIDITDLPLVINFDLPNIPETYVHRIGRTGRAGHAGTAISFCDTLERPYLADIEKTIGRKVPVGTDEPMAPPSQAAHIAAPVKKEPVSRQTRSERPSRKPAGKIADGNRSTDNSRSRRKPTAAMKKPEGKRTKPQKTVEKQTRQQKPAVKRETKPENTEARKTRVRKEAQANAAQSKSPRRGATGGGRAFSGRQTRYDRNEPRYDAHTPTKSDALSEQAAERIRQKVAAKLTARAEQPAKKTEDKPKSTRNTRAYHNRKK